MIDITKKYRYNKPCFALRRIVFTDGLNLKCPVLSERVDGTLVWHDADGKDPCYGGNYDLLEITEWDDCPVDAPIWVRINKFDWAARHFSHYADGKVFAWQNGGTSHTTNMTEFWRIATRTKPKDA